MKGFRISPRDGYGTEIDRSTPVNFTFDGKPFQGFRGETLASALLASGVRRFGRSFKYHRPRGLFSAGPEEPSALMTLRLGARREPNTKATMIELFDGLAAQSQNRWPSLDLDLMAINQLGGPLLSAGFYYKTFMGPTQKAWMVYEHFIRRAAGLGKATHLPDPDRYERTHAYCDVLIVGGGAAGLAAARAAAATGARVILADENARMGGALLAEAATINGMAARTWAETTATDLDDMANVTVLPRTTVYGYYDDNQLGAVERVADHVAAPPDGTPRQRHWTITAKRVVLATGALERPIVFAGNDTPGIMLADAGRTYLRRFGAAPGRRVALFATHDGAYRAARDAAEAGLEVTAIIDPRPTVSDTLANLAMDAGAELVTGHAVTRAEGGKSLEKITVAPVDSLSGTTFGTGHPYHVDTLLVSGGHTPVVHLASQAGGAPVWDDDLTAFLPGTPREAWAAAGACAGHYALTACLNTGTRVGADAAADAGFAGTTPEAPSARDDLSLDEVVFLREVKAVGKKGWLGPKSFVDLQHDVTASDIHLAHREGFVAVEHLKRYTTLGMAADQGKTSNVTGLAIMADALGKDVPDVGTTRFRPPYTPVAIGALAGRNVGGHFAPVRRTPMHDWHVANGGLMLVNGPWMRPHGYLREGETLTDAYIREARQVRQSVGIADVSTLGKIDIQGPHAGELVNRMYSNGFAKLPIGKARYGLMLREDGTLYDDGTCWRLGEHHFLMTTTTANAGLVMANMEKLLSVYWTDLRVSLSSITDQWAGVSVAGPNSRTLLKSILTDVDLSDEGCPFMGVRRACFDGHDALVARLSFSGEMAYEVYVGAHHGLALWEHMVDVGKPLDLVTYGLEALGTLRIEKGHIAGPEIDGRSTADDVGLGKMISRKKAFVGSTMIDREALIAPGRLQLVGLIAKDFQPIRSGSHLVANSEMKEPAESLGHVTSYTYSPALETHIALAMLKDGRSRHGETLYATYPLRGDHGAVTVTDPVFFDKDGSRMHG
ncbi:MAG: sarcosine oxidase subunit alpha family protein [Pseudomonadota bacterium]